jgi:hypothetical protein
MRNYYKQHPGLPQGFSESFPSRFWEKVNKSGTIPEGRTDLGPCWVWIGGTNPHGYGVIQKGGRKCGLILASRAAWILSFGNLGDEDCVLHRCDNPPCVNPQHLFKGTKKDNTHDMMGKGRAYWPCPAKVSDEQVLLIRRLCASHAGTYGQIGEMFGVDASTIYKIFRRKSHSYVIAC